MHQGSGAFSVNDSPPRQRAVRTRAHKLCTTVVDNVIRLRFIPVPPRLNYLLSDTMIYLRILFFLRSRTRHDVGRFLPHGDVIASTNTLLVVSRRRPTVLATSRSSARGVITIAVEHRICSTGRMLFSRFSDGPAETPEDSLEL